MGIGLQSGSDVDGITLGSTQGTDWSQQNFAPHVAPGFGIVSHDGEAEQPRNAGRDRIALDCGNCVAYLREHALVIDSAKTVNGQGAARARHLADPSRNPVVSVLGCTGTGAASTASSSRTASRAVNLRGREGESGRLFHDIASLAVNGMFQSGPWYTVGTGMIAQFRTAFAFRHGGQHPAPQGRRIGQAVLACQNCCRCSLQRLSLLRGDQQAQKRCGHADDDDGGQQLPVLPLCHVGSQPLECRPRFPGQPFGGG
ncbi:MAG: hypothetical protein OXF20_08270, partial [Gammaproteobacteria bacterium]|nr:hypothetical protein [Gammaproteobacteria bacterium]